MQVNTEGSSRTRMEVEMAKNWPEPTEDEPTMEEIEEWVFDISMPRATDGCEIEPDGVCEHGHPSWMLKLGLI